MNKFELNFGINSIMYFYVYYSVLTVIFRINFNKLLYLHFVNDILN